MPNHLAHIPLLPAHYCVQYIYELSTYYIAGDIPSFYTYSNLATCRFDLSGLLLRHLYTLTSRFNTGIARPRERMKATFSHEVILPLA